jgi:hypothetical protein
MKFIPILFKPEMVQAILEGRKTMTRRVVKLKNILSPKSIHKDGSGKGWVAWSPRKVSAEETARLYPGEDGFKCPYGQPGDVLWVRETHYRYGSWFKNGVSKTGKQKWKFVVDKNFPNIRYTDNPPEKIEKANYHGTGWHKRNSLFMPKEACRLFLKITNIRVERLQDISEADAWAEGVSGKCYDKRPCQRDNAGHSFCTLWQSINGKESWDANPWLWVVSFEKCNQPEIFYRTKEDETKAIKEANKKLCNNVSLMDVREVFDQGGSNNIRFIDFSNQKQQAK